ncbi:hypothetical protein RA19_00155 [Leisingera sp. ANG-M1]|uniref:tape measure protein n=1 Tax=Leisingera sp. ANG-M1 TaxID=1577895 RepID=UPI00057FCD70|nr:tape measure protein [Leisingera sp. ANG-M1]KIC12856.1 hypothetical protein RA19_00155 [Leisingera sp. ANG-M1]
MTDFARLGIAVDSGQVVRARDELGRFVQAGRTATVANDNFATSAARSAAAAAGVTSALRSAVRQMAAFAGVTASVRAVGGAAESYTKMTNSLRAMGIEAGQAAGVLQSIADVANRTRAPLDATAQLYQRISIAGRDLGASQADVLRFTENVGLALAQTGTSSQEASGALLQLSQAMAGGTVRAEEFNSILEGAFPIAQAAANAIDGASGSVGRLRQMVVDGEISSREFFEAILSQTDALEMAFEQTVPTVSQAFGVLGNNFTMFIGEMDAAAGVSGAVAEAVLLVANNLNTVAGFAVSAGVAVAAAYAPAIYGAVTATGAWVASLITLRGALIATGVGALVVGAGLLIGYFLDLVEATGGWGAAMRVLGTLADGVFQGITEAAKAIEPALDAVWSYVAAGFLKMVRSIARTWTDFLRSIVQGAKNLDFLPGMDATILALNNAAIAAGSGVNSLTSRIDGYQDAAGGALNRSRALIKNGFNKASAALATLNLVIEKHGKGSREASDAAATLNDALKDLEKGSKKSGKGLDKVKSEAEAFAEAMEEAAYNTEDLGKAKADILISGIDSVSNAWGDFVARGFSDFKGFVDNILGSFQGLLAQMIAMAARNQIMIGLGFGGVTGGAVQAAGAAVGRGGGLLNLAGGAANLVGGGGLLSGFASGLGGILSGGGLGASFATLGGLAGGSVGLSAGALGAALPALGIIVGAASLLKSAFSRKYKGSGIDGTFSGDGFYGGEFDYYKGGLFRSDRWNTRAISPEMDAALDAAMAEQIANLEQMAGALGLSSDGIRDVTGQEFKIWTNGKDQEEIQEELEAQLGLVTDQMAELILSGQEVVETGETASETLSRLAGGLMAVNDIMDLLGATAFQTSVAGGQVAADLVDEFGGAEQMQAAANAYFSAFYAEAEKAETLQRRAMEQVESQFNELGIVMPKSRAEFRRVVEGLDLTSESGRALYADLLNLSAGLAQVLPDVQQFTAAMQSMVNDIGGELGLQIDAARERERLAEQSANLWYRTANTLRDFLSDLLNTDLTSASASQALRVNQGRFETAFDLARGGDVEAARDIPALAKAYLESARSNASTSLEYRRIAAQVQGQVGFLAGIADLEGANDDVLRGLYEQQIDVLTNLGKFLQLEGLTGDQVAELGDGVQALTENWDGTVEAFQTSLGALEDAIKNAEAFSYDDLVGRLDVAVSLADDAPRWVQRLVDSADAGLRTTLDFVIRNDELSPADKWIATNAASEHVATLDFVLRNDLDKRTKKLALQTSADLQRNLNLNLIRDLDADTRSMVLTRNATLTRRVNVALKGDSGKTINKLNRIQDLIGTNGSGKLTFDGGISLTTDQAFKGLSDGVQDLVSPMNRLHEMLGELRDAVDADRQQRADAITVANAQVRGQELAGVLAGHQGDAAALQDQLEAIYARHSIKYLGSGFTLDDLGRIAGPQGGIEASGAAGFGPLMDDLRKTFGVKGGTVRELIGQIITPQNALIDNGLTSIDDLRQLVIDHGGIPAFANGGTHRGGFARVGENDIELVAPSRIYNPADTKAMLDNREVVKELAELRKEVAALRKDKQRADFQKLREAQEIKRLAQKQDVVGVKIQEEQA